MIEGVVTVVVDTVSQQLRNLLHLEDLRSHGALTQRPAVSEVCDILRGKAVRVQLCRVC